MCISKYILSPQEKPFVSHTRHPEPVLSTALKCSARMGNVWHPCHTHESNTSENLFLNFGFKTICIDQKMTYERSLINVFDRIFKLL